MSFIKGKEKKKMREQEVAVREVAPDPIAERPVPTTEEYLDPYVGEGARKRVIIMTSPDDSHLEPIQRINMSLVNATRIQAQALLATVVNVTDILIAYEQRIAQQQQQIAALSDLVTQLQQKLEIDHARNPNGHPTMPPAEVG